MGNCMNCLKCGKEIPEESKFCQNCGQAVESRQLELQSKQPKKTHKFLKYGCGCLCVVVTAFIILGFIIDCNMTPEEKATIQERQRIKKLERAKQKEAKQKKKAEERRIKEAEQAKQKEAEQKKKEFEQAEKLKPSAFLIARQFMKKNLNDPFSAKFESYDSENPKQVIWIEKNEFLVISVCWAKNLLGSYVKTEYGAWVKYLGEDKWECKFIGNPEKAIRKAMPGIYTAAVAQRKADDAKFFAQAKEARIQAERKEEIRQKERDAYNKRIKKSKARRAAEEKKKREEEAKKWQAKNVKKIENPSQLQRSKFYRLETEVTIMEKLNTESMNNPQKLKIQPGHIIKVWTSREFDNSIWYDVYVYDNTVSSSGNKIIAMGWINSKDLILEKK